MFGDVGQVLEKQLDVEYQVVLYLLKFKYAGVEIFGFFLLGTAPHVFGTWNRVKNTRSE